MSAAKRGKQKQQREVPEEESKRVAGTP